MTIVAIPRSTNISAKEISPTDFEKYFRDHIADHVVTGMTITDGGGLNATIAVGEARIEGVHVEITVAETAALTDASTNHIFLQLSRDGSSEVDSASIVVNTTGTKPSDSIKLGEVVTAGAAISTIDQAMMPQSALSREGRGGLGSEVAIATGALDVDDYAVIVVASESGTSDTLDTITNAANGDRVALVAKSGHTITVTHDVGGTDSIHLREHIDILLSETVPMILERRGAEWYTLTEPKVTPIVLAVEAPADALSVDDNQVVFPMPFGGKLIKAQAEVHGADTGTGVISIAVRNDAGTDMFSTDLTIDTGEDTSATAAAPVVIKSDGNEDVVAGDKIKIDIDDAGNDATGLVVTLWFENLGDE